MANYLITGHTGEAHVTAENDRCIHASALGTGRFVLPVGNQLELSLMGGSVYLKDGYLMDNGTAACIPFGNQIHFTITAPSQGMRRNDLVVFKYSKDPSTLIESGDFTIVRGDEYGGETINTNFDPSLTQNDFLSGHNFVFDYVPLWRVVAKSSTTGWTVEKIERIAPVVWQNPPMEEGVEYCTSEFFNGKRVYTMLVKYQHTSTIGSTSSNTDITIDNVIEGFKYLVSCEVSNNLNSGRYTFPHVSNSGGIVLVESVAWDKITLRLFKRDWAASTWYFRIKYTKD